MLPDHTISEYLQTDRLSADAAGAPRLAAIPLFIALIATSVWLCAVVFGPSFMLAQSFGVGIFLVLALYLGITLTRRPKEVGRPMSLFCLGCIYFFVLDAAFLWHGARDFEPASLLAADTLIAVFVIVTSLTHKVTKCPGSFLAPLFKGRREYLTGNAYFLLAVLAVAFEYLQRLYFVDFSLFRLWHDLFLGRSVGAFRVGVADDWRVVLAPISVLFLLTTVFADLAWRRGISGLKKGLLLVVVAVQLGTLVLDTVRADLLTAILTPIFIRAAQNDRSVGRLLGVLVLGLAFLFPLMSVMNYARNGWQGLQIERYVFEDPGEDDFFWLTNLVAYKSQNPGLLEYKSPFGFAQGFGEIGRNWATIAIPRVLWPEKPRYWEEHDETRGWYAADSVIGDLFRAGGVSCVIGGAILFGLWLSLLDGVYVAPKADGEAIAYVFLAVSVVSMTRDALPFNTVPLLLSCLLFVISWNMPRFFPALRPRGVWEPPELPQRFR